MPIPGSRLNLICKAVSIYDSPVALYDGISVVDPAHVSIIQITSTDGGPIFGVVDNERCIEPESFLKLKVEDGVKFDVDVKDGLLRLVSTDGDIRYGIRAPESQYESAKLNVELDGVGYVKIKDFLDVVKQADGIGDHFTLKAEEGGVYIEADDGFGSVIRKRIIKGYEGDPMSAMYPTEPILKFLKFAKGEALISFRDKYPISFAFVMEDLFFRIYVAPRVEG